ncbi:MAG TPA: LysE family translocator [Allosphingosinicella sp.]|nr:LysE family translocator [Allosphingosinicella sp.]
MSPILPSLVAFTAAAALLTVTPGLDTALVLRTATADGARRAFAAGLGICLGCLAWGVATAFGLGLLLRASSFAYTALRWTGAAYLLWLGVHLLMRPRGAFDTEAVAPRAEGSAWFRRGFLTNLLNPKVGIFYMSFLPQFIPPGADVAFFTLLLATVHALLGLAWFALLVVATRPLAMALRRPALVRTLDRVTGGLFLLFGLRLALTRD